MAGRRALALAALAVPALVTAVGPGVASGAGSTGPVAVATSIVPLASPPIDGSNCYYTNTWMAPRSGGRRHEGVDIIAPSGTTLFAAQGGKVVRSQGSLAGNQLKIVAPDGTYFIYAHLSAYADDTAPQGATVPAGTVVGYVGHTGDTTVNHLHFEVHPASARTAGSKSIPAVDPTPVVAAVNTCGAKVAANAMKHPSPWANVDPSTPTTPTTSTTTAGRPTTSVPPTTTRPLTTTRPPTTTVATGPTTLPSHPTTAPPRPTTSSPTTSAPATSGPTTSGPSSPLKGPVSFSPAKTVLATSSAISANRTVGIKVVGFPGIPGDARTVDLVISLSGSGAGNAAVWPCGQKAGLSNGTPLNALGSGGTSTTKVTVGVGDQGRVCLVTTAAATLTVGVAGAR